MEHLNPQWLAESYPKPSGILPPNRKFLQQLKPGDCILGSREPVIVARGVAHPNRTCWVAKIKRPLQKVPITLRQCMDDDSCVEIQWSFNEGFKCIAIDTLTVVR